MSPHLRSRSDVGSARGERPPWFPLVAGVAPVVLFFALLRWAVDLLLSTSTLLLLAHSTRDTFRDWLAGESFEGEADPVWALGAVLAGVFGTVVGGVWLFATSDFGGRITDRYAPAVLVDTVAFAERHGWGQRAFLPESSRSRAGAPVTTNAAPAAAAGGGSDVRAAATSGPATAATPDRRTPPAQGAVTTIGEIVPTRTTLQVSDSSVEQGTPVTLTATVAASIPRTGTVTFRRGRTAIGTASVDAEGHAALVVAGLRRGTHAITAEFGGSSALESSRSSMVWMTVR